MSDPHGIQSLYERHASQYDSDRTRILFEATWLDRFCAAMKNGRSILDLGCGCGEPIAQHLIQREYQLTGVDSSPSLIHLCRTRFPAHQWIVDDMRRFRAPDTFDGILAWDSLFHLSPDDQRAMFPIFGALSHPGTALMFTCGPQHGVVYGTYAGEPLYHASLDPDEYRAQLEAQGFSILSFVQDDPTCTGHAICLAVREAVNVSGAT